MLRVSNTKQANCAATDAAPVADSFVDETPVLSSATDAVQFCLDRQAFTDAPEVPELWKQAHALATERGADAPLRRALLELLELAKQNAFQSKNGYGFFDTTCEGASEMRDCRAALSLCRALLEQLEGDWRAALVDETKTLRAKLTAFEALESGSTE